MKNIVLLGDGMSDYPLEALAGKTPLMAARTPNMDFLARQGLLGQVQTVPDGFSPGSDVANLSVMGYDPKVFFTGRAPLEAASLRLALEPEDVAFRCNLVTLQDQNGSFLMEDFSAGHISNADSHPIIRSLQEALGNDEFSFHPGVGYRHLLVWRAGKFRMQTTPPHDITGREVSSYLPQGEGSEKILALMEASRSLLASHPVNQRRIQEGKRPATTIWLWGQGKALNLPSFEEKYRCTGAVISAVDLIKGIGIAAGLEPIQVPGVTGYLDTNYRGKAEYALEALKTRDFAFVHVEAPDEAGHNGDLKGKIQAIEDFDAQVVGTVLDGIRQFPAFRVLVLPDHPTPISIRTHAPDPVPFVIYPSPPGFPVHESQGFDEASARQSGFFLPHGHRLMDLFLTGKSEPRDEKV